MKKYQAIFIINLQLASEDIDSIISEINNRLKQDFSGKNIQEQNLGIKNLVYPIEKMYKAIFLRFIFELDPDKVSDFKDSYSKDKKVLRLVIYRYDIPENVKTLKIKT